MKDYKEHLILEKLGLSIQMLAKPSMDSSVETKIKGHLMEKVRLIEQSDVPETLIGVVKYIKRLVAELNFGVQERAAVKERIFSMIDGAPQKNFFYIRVFDFSKKFVSATLVVAIAFGMMSFVGVNTNVVRAETFTTLDSFSGSVSLERNGEMNGVYIGMEIKEKDKIITGGNGIAVISYFDDSVTRLSKDTELVVSKLFVPENSHVDTYVEVALLNGAVWSKVINLVGRNSSFVVKADDVYASSKRAAFNVEKNDKKVEVKVFNNTVNVVNEDKSDKVVSGQKVVVSQDKVEIAQIPDSEKNTDWVKGNIDSDKEYLISVEERLVAAKMKSIGANTENDLSLENSLKENAVLFLTFGDVEKQKTSLDLAEKKIIAAEVKLHGAVIEEGDKKEVQAAIDDFSKQVTDFYAFVKEVGYTDEEYAAELKKYADEKILLLKKDLTPILPDSPLYGLKDQVDKLLVVGAFDNKQAAEIKLDQVVDKLGDAEEVASTGSGQTIADTLVSESKQNIDEAEKIIESIENANPEDKDLVGLRQKVDELKEATVVPNVVEVDDDLTNPVAGDNGESEEPEEQPYGVNIEGDKPLPPGL